MTDVLNQETVFYTGDDVTRSIERLGRPGNIDESRVMLAAESFARMLNNPGTWTVTESIAYGKPGVIVRLVPAEETKEPSDG